MYFLSGAASYISSSSNYSVINTNNFFNFLIGLMDSEDEAYCRKIITSMRIQLGLRITNQFKQYVFKKIPTSHILRYFNDFLLE